MAPGGGLGFIRIQAQMVHLIGDRQPAAGSAAYPMALQQRSLAGGALVAQQLPIPARIVAVGGGIPVAQPQPKPGCRLMPLQTDRGAMAEHHEPLQPALPLQLAKAQQGSQGLARSRASVNEYVLAPLPLLNQASPQQLDQLALPLAGLHIQPSWRRVARPGLPPELKGERRGRGVHGGH